MNDTSKKVGYLKGLLEGVNPDESTLNGKLLTGIVELLSDLSERVDVIDELIDDLNDYVESIDDDLSALEDADGVDSGYSLDSDDEDFDDDLDGDDLDDAEDQLHILNNDVHDGEDEDSLAGSLCPECGRMFFISFYDPDDALYLCPHCSKQVHPVPLTPENAPIAHPI